MFHNLPFCLYAISLFWNKSCLFTLKKGFVSRKGIFFFLYVFLLILKVLDLYSYIFKKRSLFKKNILQHLFNGLNMFHAVTVVLCVPFRFVLFLSYPLSMKCYKCLVIANDGLIIIIVSSCYDKEHTAGVTGQQKMLTPQWHLILLLMF